MIPSRFLLSLCCATLMAAPPEVPAKLLEHPSCLTGPAAIQIFAEGTFLHLTAQATQHNLGSRMKELVPQFQKALAVSGLVNLGPLHVVYHGLSIDPDKPFDLELGVLVPKGTQASVGCQVRTLAAFTCATMVFTGPLTMVGKAYGTLYPALMASGRIPLPESRQMILFWEGETSNNNMLLIQIGIQGP